MDALASELNGEIVHRFGIEGATSILMFPIADKTLSGGEPSADERRRLIAATAEAAGATASAERVSERADTMTVKSGESDNEATSRRWERALCLLIPHSMEEIRCISRQLGPKPIFGAPQPIALLQAADGHHIARRGLYEERIWRYPGASTNGRANRTF